MSHWLFTQTAEPFAGTAQPCPQPPQFAASFVVSMQLPEHAVSAPQPVPHTPFEHDSPTAQGLSHCPQWAGLFEVSTHSPPHFARPESQMKSQTFALQIAVPNAGALH